MPLVDDRGRLFGRWNLFDTVVVVLLAGVIPVAYGAYVLFRTPAPTLTAVQPAVLTQGPLLRVTVKGENLRPYLRVSFNTSQARNFLFNSTKEAEVDVAGLPPGVYDVVLYDFTQERSRLPGALTVLPSPLPQTAAIAVGMLGSLKAADVGRVKPGLILRPAGEILSVGTSAPGMVRANGAGNYFDVPVGATMRVPIAIRLNCTIQTPGGIPQCYAGDTPVQPNSLLTVDSDLGQLTFQVDQLRSTAALRGARLVVRFGGPPEVQAAIHAGDVDLGLSMNELAAGARVVSVSGTGQGQVNVVLDAQVQDSTMGLVYAMSPVRLGGSFYFRTRAYEVQGIVTGIAPSGAAPASSK